MATADEIRAQIAASQQDARQAANDRVRAVQESIDAEQRQKLRRELENIRAGAEFDRLAAQGMRTHRQNIDEDRSGPHLHAVNTEFRHGVKEVPVSKEVLGAQAVGVADCEADIVNGAIEWTIKGFSWLRDTMEQNEVFEMSSPEICVGKHQFSLLYDPAMAEMGACDQKGSLVIFHKEAPNYEGVVFRYKIWIKSKEQGYVQWGDSGSVCMPNEDTHHMIFGPDVCKPPHTPKGVFGMTHDQLQHSEWVINDALTAKLEIQVRPMVAERATADRIEVPPPCIGDNLLLLLDDAVGSDVTFKFEGDTIKAHSQILSARSEVLKKLFSCGMQESTSKEVTIEDCEPRTFKAFLRYLYSDNFASVERLITSETSGNSSESAQMSSESANGTPMLMLRQLLAVSHKYQVTRLQVWCERKLSQLISIEEACSVLVQAHLFEAKQLEKKCLDFITANMSEVVKTESFASLSRLWPEVSLKITLCIAGVSEGTATAAMEVQKNMRKRKRDD